MTIADWKFPEGRFLAYVLGPLEQGRPPIFIVLNAAPEEIAFELPKMPEYKNWQQILNTTESKQVTADFASGGRLVAHRTPHHVDIMIMHDREEPGANVGAGLPKMGLGYRAQQRLLHEIVGAVSTPSESPRIAPQSRNLSLDETVKIGHWFFLPANPHLGALFQTYVHSVIGV